MQRRYKSMNARRFKRLRADYLMKAGMLDRPGVEPQVSNIRDISAGGVRYITRQAVAEGMNVRVRVYVPPIDRMFESVGKVVRVRRAEGGPLYYVAVRFLEADKEVTDSLNAFVEHLARDRKSRRIVDHTDIVLREKEEAGV